MSANEATLIWLMLIPASVYAIARLHDAWLWRRPKYYRLTHQH